MLMSGPRLVRSQLQVGDWVSEAGGEQEAGDNPMLL